MSGAHFSRHFHFDKTKRQGEGRQIGRWTITGGPREFESLGGRDMDVGWSYELVRGDERATVSVIVAGGRLNSSDLPPESKTAIETSGRSAVTDLLDRDQPPRYVAVTSFGLREEGAEYLL